MYLTLIISTSVLLWEPIPQYALCSGGQLLSRVPLHLGLLHGLWYGSSRSLQHHSGQDTLHVSGKIQHNEAKWPTQTFSDAFSQTKTIIIWFKFRFILFLHKGPNNNINDNRCRSSFWICIIVICISTVSISNEVQITWAPTLVLRLCSGLGHEFSWALVQDGSMDHTFISLSQVVCCLVYLH